MNNEVNGDSSLNGVDNNTQNIQPNDLNNQSIDNNINNQNPVNENQMNNSSLGTDNMFQAPTGMTDQQNTMNQQIPNQPVDNNMNNNQQNSGGGIFSNNFQNINNDGSLRIALKEDAKTKPKEKLLLGIILGILAILGIYLATTIMSTIIASKVPILGIILILAIMIGIIFLGCCFLGGFVQASMKMSKVGEITLKEIFSWPFSNIKYCLQTILVGGFYSIITSLIITISFMLLNKGILLLFAIIIMVLTLFIVQPMMVMAIYSLIDEDNTDKGIIKCIKQGFILSKDRILQYNALKASYAGWMLIQPLSLGILIPDMAYAVNNFYKYAKGEKTFEKAKTGISDKGILLIVAGCALVFFTIIGMNIGKIADKISTSGNSSSYYDTWDSYDYEDDDNDDDHNFSNDSDNDEDDYDFSDSDNDEDDYDFSDSEEDEDKKSDDFRVKQ